MARRRYSPQGTTHKSEDSYFISMTDILVGLLFIFIILIVFFAILVARENRAIKKPAQDQSIEVMVIALGNLRDNLEKSEKERKELEKELARARGAIASGAQQRDDDRASIVNGLSKRLQKDGAKGMMPLAEIGILRFTGAGIFAPGKFDLPDGSNGNLLFTRVAGAIVEEIECFAYRDKKELGMFSGNFVDSKKISEESEINSSNDRTLVIYGERCSDKNNATIQALMIEGHTDDIPFTGRDNLWLSAQRALSVYRLMVKKEPILKKYYNIEGEPVISFSGYGEDRPVATNDTPAGRSANRRTDIRLIMDSPYVLEIDSPFSEN